MKNKLVALLTALGLGLLSVGVLAAAPEKAANKKPILNVDTSPVSDGKSPLVTSYADVLQAVRPAVVSVYSTKIVRQQVPPLLRQMLGNIPDQERRMNGLGSGVIVSSDGYILTNNHVVDEADELKVLLNDDRELIAKVIGTDPKTDVAVIKIDAENLPAVTLADSDKLRVGDVVFAIGNPLGVGQTVTMGIVSATGRRVGILDEVGGYEDFIQTDAAINRGNSGGALIDAKGRVVGINSAIITTTQGSIGLGFAIPMNLVRSIMNSLIETGSVSRGYLGVSTEQLNSELAEALGLKGDTKGVVITQLNPANGPAAKAGLKREDIIVAINDKPVGSRDDLRLTIAQMAPGTKIKVSYLRGGKPLAAEATLGRAEDDDASVGDLLPGVTVAPLTDDIRREMRLDDDIEGLVITNVAEGTRYAEVFPVGAVIEQINRQPVTDLASAKKALKPKAKNMAYIYYRGLYRYLFFPAP
ncbi:MAG: Do family serine endopeptidase [Opitutae bacterium]|nr:Do family serine endopeptidase [Opitutae bacterium]